MEFKDLQGRLADHHIPLAEWGRGEAMPLINLSHAIIRNEAELESPPDGRLFCNLYGVCLEILVLRDGSRHQLRKTAMIASGDRRLFVPELNGVWVARHKTEIATMAACRFLREHVDPSARCVFERKLKKAKPTPQVIALYPGLPVIFDDAHLSTQLDPSAFKDGEFEVKEHDMTTRYKWIKVA